ATRAPTPLRPPPAPTRVVPATDQKSGLQRTSIERVVPATDQKSGLQRTSTERAATMAPTRVWHPPLLLLALVQAFIGAGAGLFIPYFNVYFVQHLGASPALFGVLNGGATALNAVLTLAAPWLAMRLGKV